MSRSSEGRGHNACSWKGLDLSNNVCEYEVTRLTNESYNWKTKLWHTLLKNNVECQGHLTVNEVWVWSKSVDII